VGGGWPCEDAPREILLTGGRALSGSGTEVKGRHIIDPRTGAPAAGHLAAWALHASAAAADALSTAFMVMDTAAVEAYCRSHPDIWALVIKAYGDGRMFGNW
jgi:thiamine biosynthesis lipoprotein ApbE